MAITETLLQKFLQLDKKVDNIDKEVTYVRKNLFGNGEIGLAEQVRLNSRFREGFNKFLWVLVSAIIGQSVLLIFAIFK